MNAPRAASETTDRVAAAREALDLCERLGFAQCGIAPAEPVAHGRELADWLAAGRHGEMSWLAEHLEQRLDPRRRLPGAQSIICVADRYPGPLETEQSIPPRHGRIARYARGEDYHHIMKRRLHDLCDELRRRAPGDAFIACVDTAPVAEREHALAAGLGYIGKNTMLIEPGVGSYLLLGEVLTTLALAPSQGGQVDHCGACTRCLDACPTQALAPWVLDSNRCISYHTIELRGEVSPQFHEAIGDWLFGCDICQDVCPHNGPTPRTTEAPVHPAYESRHASFDLLEVLGWTEEDRRTVFTRSAMKRAKLWMMKRNAIIVAGNRIAAHHDPDLLARIESLAADEREHDTVRATAAQVAARLKRGKGQVGDAESD